MTGVGKPESRLPKPLQAYIAVLCVGGAALLAYLLQSATWETTTVLEAGLFSLLVVVAGSFPLTVGPTVKADVTTTVLFAAAVLFQPGVAALVGVLGILGYTISNRYRGEKLLLPWYKYPFNAAETALYVGMTSLVFDALATTGQVLTPAVVPAAGVLYLANTSMVTLAASLQLGANPLRLWWRGTRENGPSELAQLAVGFLGAMAYLESRWTLAALVMPVGVIYFAFSRQANAFRQLGEAMTELRALQGRVVSNSKLASIGAMSLELAHQVNNPLTIVLARLENIQIDNEIGSPTRRDADIAMNAGQRIQSLTQSIFSNSSQDWVHLNMGELLDEALSAANIRSHKNVQINREYQPEGLEFNGHPVLIKEALFNVLTNALDAVEATGQISMNSYRVDGTVVARISDNGMGIPADRMAGLFEPFHSTKPNGHGLGLFTARHILELHEGRIDVESVEHRGTSVTIVLPAHQTQDERVTPGPDGVSSVQTR